MKTYEEQVWKYLVRQWRSDGCDQYLAIVTNGQTDNLTLAFDLMIAQSRPTHVFDVLANEVILRNY